MICKQCGDSAILNSANGNEFYYCRNCKVEVVLEEAPKDEPKKNEDEWPHWYQPPTPVKFLNFDYDDSEDIQAIIDDLTAKLTKGIP